MGSPFLGAPPSLEDALDSSLSYSETDRLTARMQANLAAYEKMVLQCVQQGVAGRVAVVELDRSILKSMGSKISWDFVPALRCNAPKLWVMSAWGMEMPRERRAFFRFLHVAERFALQGHDKQRASSFKARGAAERAAGNAYNNLRLAVMVAPLVEAAVLHGAMVPEGPKQFLAVFRPKKPPSRAAAKKAAAKSAGKRPGQNA